MANVYFRSSKPVAKEEKLEEQRMPRAAKDLMKRQLIMKKTATKKKAEKKQKKTGKCKLHAVST